MKMRSFKPQNAGQPDPRDGTFRRGPRVPAHALRRGGFTLIELMIVIAIAALLTAITVGAFREISVTNKRTTCQGNLSQLYTAARLYAADEGGRFPYYNASSYTLDDPSEQPAGGIGLWALYAFPDPSDPSKIAPLNAAVQSPLNRYLRHPKVFHCPSDLDPTSGTSHENLYTDAARTAINPEYLSYQVLDGNIPTYQSIRTTDSSDPNFKRQLLIYNGASRVSRPPADNTVVAWCKYHRMGGSRNFDNVLFYDGSVQLLPVSQDDPDGSGAVLTDATRKPKAVP
jgi:prepilin-type N-terminal cleavage/methylation domain-containing protein